MKTYTVYEKNTQKIIKRWTSQDKGADGNLLDENYYEPCFGEEYTIEINDLGDIPKWREIIRIRNKLLLESDWTQLNDNNLSKNKVEEFKVYRQKLRDLMQTTKNPYEVDWPKKPIISTRINKKLKQMLHQLENNEEF